MKCGICGNTERIMFEKNISYYGKDSQKRDSNGEPIKQLNDDGSVIMRPIYDASDMTEHKRFEHPAEVEAIEEKRKATKRTNAQLKDTMADNMAKVYRAGRDAVASPVLDWDSHWQFRSGAARKDGAYHLTTSRTGGHEADRARHAVRQGFGDEAIQFNGGHYFRQITDEDVTELTNLDKAIKDLQEQRNDIAAQMYERGGQLTNQHVADLGDASQAACEEFERMLNEEDELDTDEGRLTDSAVEDIVEAAMANQPTKFIAYSAETMAEALGAYGY
jgi:hypothetical protein